jgi:hypothetical protein
LQGECFLNLGITIERNRGKWQEFEDMMTATEIAAFVYCPERWRLEHGLGLKLANRAALDAGTRARGIMRGLPGAPGMG